jgi:hypothetical protein
VTSSDAFKNVPFVLIGTGQSGSNLTFTPNESYSKVYSTTDGDQINVVKVPKSAIGFVPIGTYSMTDTIAHMPLVRTSLFLPCRSKPALSISNMTLCSPVDPGV